MKFIEDFVLKVVVPTSCPCCGSGLIKKSPAILMPFVASRVFDWEPTIIDESWGLRDVPNGLAYPLCSSSYCVDCRFLFLDIRFTDDQMAMLYNGYRGETYVKQRAFFEPGYVKRNLELDATDDEKANIECFVEPFLSRQISVLDWGGGDGSSTPFVEKFKYSYVYDISGVDVVPGCISISKLKCPLNRYDLVICSNVLEHVPDPYSTLTEIKSVLDDDSILYVDVPFESLLRDSDVDSHLRKRHWHEHINFFSEESLDRLFARVGFSVLNKKIGKKSATGEEAFVFRYLAKKSSR